MVVFNMNGGWDYIPTISPLYPHHIPIVSPWAMNHKADDRPQPVGDIEDSQDPSYRKGQEAEEGAVDVGN